MTLSKYWGG